MKKTVVVDVVHGGEQLSHDTEKLFLFTDTADPLKEFPSLNQVHGKEIILRRHQVPVNGPDGTEIVDAHNMGVAKRTQDLKLLFEEFQAGSLRHIKIDDLDDDIHRKRKITGFIDDPHGAFSDFGDDGVSVVNELHIL
jgi:hypothetical protein